MVFGVYVLRRLSANALERFSLAAQFFWIGRGNIVCAAGGAVVGCVRVIEEV